MATYSYTTSFNQYPQNQVEMKLSCDRIGEGLKCLKIYGKCLNTGLTKRALITFSAARSRHSKKLCANMNDPKTVDFWKASECIKTKNKRVSMVASEKELISTLQLLTVETTMSWEERFHQSCCAASNYVTKVIKIIEPDCAKYKDTYEDMMSSSVGEVLDSACPEQARLNELCPKLKKLVLTKDWKPVSLGGATLEFIVALSDRPKNKK